MHAVRKQRLFLVLFIVIFASAAVGLLVFALRENINLFYPPSKIVAGEAPIDKHIRAGGCVLPGTVKRSTTDLGVSFLITDGAANVEVHYSGILPDLFAEGEAAVVTGSVNGDGIFMATQVLAKHDENYTPPEVADMAGDGVEHQAICEVMPYDS
ncbi:cytochrome c maturation protein CcmE [Halioxenophilus sp. WMMB6]|uniref:cytochrome c maturation protein CcmE n=1 Tax=Halioxenophilus sp. WMMB6 TaxID=3073815 RepID=UPI00295F14ED|nr:cytochrome c maturation protein CcmE [Halioxenophilus sp. WMMB6]